MSKVIIKVNSFMKTKEFTDICNCIYNQYKERDIVIVPPYCEVYVVDGNPEIKCESAEAKPKEDTQEAQNKALIDIALNTAKNLRAEGKSLAEIAKIMGYDDPAVVRTILPNAW